MSKQNVLKHTIEDHLKDVPQSVIDLFRTLENGILTLDEAQENIVNNYIGYMFAPNNKTPKLFIEVHIQKRKK